MLTLYTTICTTTHEFDVMGWNVKMSDFMKVHACSTYVATCIIINQ